MTVDHKFSGEQTDDQRLRDHDGRESQRRLSVAESRVESLERECATLQQSLTELHDQLKRSRHTEQACKKLIEDKNEWLARLAHDLRNPLGGIRGMADLMLKSSVSGLQKSQLEVVRSTATEMLDLVDDLLQLSRDGAGPQDREDVEFDLDRMLFDAVNCSALAAEKKGLDLYYYCADNLPQVIVGDPVRLRRVVANLVHNAIKFTERGEVMVRALRVQDDSGAHQLQIVVEDTGSGIRTEKQRKVFDAFWRDDSVASTDGVGLGLSICHELVTQMGGRIRVESQPGRGSRFYISLALATHVGQRFCDRPLFGCRYMLVGEPSRRRLAYRKMLERAGAEIRTCRATALQRLLSCGDLHGLMCDGVILDCVHDAEFEMALSQQFLRVTGVSQKRLILLVARSATSIWTRCEEFPGATAIAKPVDYGQLVLTLQNNVPAAQAEEAMPKIRPLRILLADDCEVNQMVAAGLLGMYGHQVDTVTNGQSAVDAVTRQAYDLVLMDLEMPGHDGLRATREMRENLNDDQLPIVGMTAHVDRTTVDRCKGSGMDACLSKPLDPRMLLATIAELTRHEPMAVSADRAEQEPDSQCDPMSSKKTDPAHDRLSPNVTNVPQRTGRRWQSRHSSHENT